MNPNFPVAGVLAVGQQHYGSAQLNIKSEKRKAHSHIVAPAHFATVATLAPACAFVFCVPFCVLSVYAHWPHMLPCIVLLPVAHRAARRTW